MKFQLNAPRDHANLSQRVDKVKVCGLQEPAVFQRVPRYPSRQIAIHARGSGQLKPNRLPKILFVRAIVFAQGPAGLAQQALDCLGVKLYLTAPRPPGFP